MSPAHAGEFFVDILEKIHVSELMPRMDARIKPISRSMPFSEFKKFFEKTKQLYFPVMDDNQRLCGIFSSTDVRGVLFSPHIEQLVVMQDIIKTDIITTTPEEDLNMVLKKITDKNIDSLPVVAADDPGKLLGMLNRREVIAEYNRRLSAIKQESAEKKSII